MKVCFTAPALAVEPTITDPGYERRSIALDAERAAKSPGTPEKLCFWTKGTHQHDLWMRIYNANLKDAS